MNSQALSVIAEEITASAALSPLVAAYAEGRFPLEVPGAEGCLHAVLIAAFAKRGKRAALVVAPTERDAAETAGDLRSLGVDAALLPWWGTVPYRSPSPSSPVWSARARILSALAGNAPPRVLVTSQRAFMSPLPPPSYTSKQRVLLQTGDTLGTPALAARLNGWGYTRVHRVQSGGEYAVRGEVVDVMTGGDEDGNEAYRITLDYDRVESIKMFDAAEQISIKSGNTETLCLSPMKEVVWDDERIEALTANLASLPEFSGKDAGGLVDRLIERGRAPDEELFFPLAFSKPASLLDYYRGFDGGADSAVVYFWNGRGLTTRRPGLTVSTRGFSEAPFGSVPSPRRAASCTTLTRLQKTSRTGFLFLR